MCHIIHMLQSQQLILHEQQQTLKKKKKIVQCSNESCHHAFILNMHSKEKPFCILSLTDFFFFWTTVPVIIKRKEAQLYFSIIRCFEQFHNVIIFMWNDLC